MTTYIVATQNGGTGCSQLVFNFNNGSPTLSGSYQGHVSFPPRNTAWHSGKEYFVSNHNSALFLVLNHNSGSPTLSATYTVGYSPEPDFSPSGNHIAVGNSNSPYFTLLNHNSGSPTFAASYQIGGTQGKSVSYSPSGNHIAVLETTSKCVLLNHNSGTPTFSGSYAFGTMDCDYSPSGNYIAVSDYVYEPHFIVLNHNSGSPTLAGTYKPSNDYSYPNYAYSGDYILLAQADNFFILNNNSGSPTLSSSYSCGACGHSENAAGTIAIPADTTFLLLNYIDGGTPTLLGTYTASGGLIWTAWRDAPPYLYSRTSSVSIGNKTAAVRQTDLHKTSSTSVGNVIMVTKYDEKDSMTHEGYIEIIKLMAGESASAIKSVCCIKTSCTPDLDQTSSGVTKSTESGLTLVDANSVKSVKTVVSNDTVQVNHIFTAGEVATIKGFGVWNDDNDVLFSLCCFAVDVDFLVGDTLTVQVKVQFRKGT